MARPRLPDGEARARRVERPREVIRARIPLDLRERLELRAKVEGLTLNAVVVRALRESVRRREGKLLPRVHGGAK